jgi:N-formylglutamate deformylase
MSEPIFNFMRGDQPVLISCPHVGTHVPDAIAARFTAEAAILTDTDWYVDWLYGDAAGALGIPMLTATHSRYVIDLNRRPDGATLYAGADNTELCPTTTFDREDIYSGDVPDEAEIAARVEAYSKPYHNKLRETLNDMIARHGVAVLIEAHSIRSHVPRFFEGKLPDLNLGTADGESADADLSAQVMNIFEQDGNYTSVLNGRFKGGYITRNFGQPNKGVHALQLEMAQCCYMDEEPPFPFRADLAEGVQPVIHKMLEAALAWVKLR